MNLLDMWYEIQWQACRLLQMSCRGVPLEARVLEVVE